MSPAAWQRAPGPRSRSTSSASHATPRESSAHHSVLGGSYLVDSVATFGPLLITVRQGAVDARLDAADAPAVIRIEPAASGRRAATIDEVRRRSRPSVRSCAEPPGSSREAGGSDRRKPSTSSNGSRMRWAPRSAPRGPQWTRTTCQRHSRSGRPVSRYLPSSTSLSASPERSSTARECRRPERSWPSTWTRKRRSSRSPTSASWAICSSCAAAHRCTRSQEGLNRVWRRRGTRSVAVFRESREPNRGLPLRSRRYPVRSGPSRVAPTRHPSATPNSRPPYRARRRERPRVRHADRPAHPDSVGRHGRHPAARLDRARGCRPCSSCAGSCPWSRCRTS